MADYVEDYIEQLKLATQNRDNFIADFTHELKTPLTSVIGYADMLRSYEMEPKQRSISATSSLQMTSPSPEPVCWRPWRAWA